MHKELEKLRIENEMLKSSLEEVNKTIAKFIEGEKKLNMLLSQQTPMLGKRGMCYNGENNERTYGNHFIRAKHNSCNYCGRMRHFAHTCFVRKSMKGKGKDKYVWVPKEQIYLIRTNPNGPKLKWIPKISSSSFVEISQGGRQWP